MIIETKNPIQLLTRKLGGVENNLKKLEEIENKGFISSRFRKYCERFLCLCQCCEESETFRNIWLGQSIRAHVDARIQLDAIGELYFSDSFKNEDLRNAYNELYCIGKNEYDKLNEKYSGDN